MLAMIAEAVTTPTSHCPAGHVYMPESGNSAQQTDPHIFLGDQLEPIFIPPNPYMQCHEMFA